MAEGVIVGGWPYVVAAYSITVIGLVAYLWSLGRRRHRIDRED